MRKYSVSIPYNCSVIVEVTAKNKQEAVRKAYDNVDDVLCCSCSEHMQIDGPADEEPDVIDLERQRE